MVVFTMIVRNAMDIEIFFLFYLNIRIRREGERQKDRLLEIFHPLIHFPSGCHGYS